MDLSKGFHQGCQVPCQNRFRLCTTGHCSICSTIRLWEIKLFVISFVVTCYKKNNSVLVNTGHSWVIERFFIRLSCYFNVSWCMPLLWKAEENHIMVKQHSVCITITKASSKTRSLALPPRNECTSCVNLLLKISVEARLTQSTPVSCTGKALSVRMRLVLPKIVLLTVNVCQTSLELKKLCQQNFSFSGIKLCPHLPPFARTVTSSRDFTT